MEEKELLEQIAEKEWKMFQVVNGSDHVSCQEDEGTFKAMRRAQFSAWSPEAAESYLRDLEAAEAQGRNLLREKYIRMMASTQPEGYAVFCGELPQLTPEQEALTAELWKHFLAQTERMREKYPALALGGRPLLASEETDGWASIETYQTGELKTYSEATLRALLAHMVALEEQGVDLAFQIQKNSITCMGYQSMEQAEQAIALQLLQQFGAGTCGSCGCYGDLSGC